jgi:hypothetical protein
MINSKPDHFPGFEMVLRFTMDLLLGNLQEKSKQLLDYNLKLPCNAL